jgi:hypothetical protein
VTALGFKLSGLTSRSLWVPRNGGRRSRIGRSHMPIGVIIPRVIRAASVGG